MSKTLFLFLSLWLGAGGVDSFAATPKQLCVEEIRKVEKEKGIEPGLLEAIAHVESKLNPYVVNACGRGHSFKSAHDAASFVKAKQREGYKNISVGLMQIHIPSHGHKFKSIEHMFEIKQNVAYSAQLIKKLKRHTGSNEGAVKLYHSPNPNANERYKARVFGAWAKIKSTRKTESITDPKIKLANASKK